MDRPSAIYESEKQLKALSDVLEGKEYKNTGATNGESKWLKYIAEQIEKNGVGGSSVQPDWNQDDQSADDYIKNRPFYEVKQPVTLLDGTFNFVNSNGTYTTQSEFAYDLIKGETYTVTFDNATYKCSAIILNGLGYALGNLSLFGEGDVDTGEPFAIGGANPEYMIVTNTSEGNHSVSVVGNNVVITKIPEKYLPLPIGIAGTGVHSEIFNSTNNVASGNYSHAEGLGTTASGSCSHVEGYETAASGSEAHAEGFYTLASSDRQHVQGKFNVEDSANIYAHIVGNGSSDTKRSNAHTLDWSGNAWYAGTVEGTAMIVKSSTSGSSKRFKITVDDSGAITATEITA